MSKSILSPLVAQWFDEYHRLAYWLARRWTKRLLDYRSRTISADELQELAQDAVCRGFDRFAKRFQFQSIEFRFPLKLSMPGLYLLEFQPGNRTFTP